MALTYSNENAVTENAFVPAVVDNLATKLGHLTKRVDLRNLTFHPFTQQAGSSKLLAKLTVTVDGDEISQEIDASEIDALSTSDTILQRIAIKMGQAEMSLYNKIVKHLENKEKDNHGG